MTTSHILGFPRMGAGRELKFAQESFWAGHADETHLRQTGRALRSRHWQAQADAGLDLLTVGDFAWYDQVLNTLALLGALPSRFGFDAKTLTLQQYYVAARGDRENFAMEMTKWFDTNYHFLVPEWTAETRFDGGVDWLFSEIAEAREHGKRLKVALVGPLTLLYLGKIKSGLGHALELLPQAVAGYRRVLEQLRTENIEVVQIDEPILALDLDPAWTDAFSQVYTELAGLNVPILLATYFGDVSDKRNLLQQLPVAGVHIDLVRSPSQLAEFAEHWPAGKVLSAGIIDGRNLWRADLDAALDNLEFARERLGDLLWVGTSCSLLHVPVDLAGETKLDSEFRSWLAFAVQKLDEVVALARATISPGQRSTDPLFAANRAAIESRRLSPRIHNALVQKRVSGMQSSDADRASPFRERIAAQQKRWNLPAFPTTTIGSFPQTSDIRQARAAYRRKELTHVQYLEKMRAEIAEVVARQEEIGLDVLVHGEPERNDMVEYFGEQLLGYAFTANGWVQSYGSRCVKPPVIFGDVYRNEAMTVGWSTYAQSLTSRPMKGMLTGPVTMLQWSFVRDDQPRETTALQIALALRDEVCDLEKAGIGMIQIDEPAIREGLPLRSCDWPHYLEWAVRAFRVTAGGVRNETQVHTHMCYSEFNDILPWIAAMDADVITIETSRSDMELLDGFGKFEYPNDIGPGVYDIHSPRIPQVDEMVRLMQKARGVIPDARLWVNPDCGLKTRGWVEVTEALRNMVQAARLLRRDSGVEMKVDAVESLAS